MNKTPTGKKKAPKAPSPYIIVDNRNLVGWILSCFVVCGCMFFIGVLVGRNTAPVQFDVDRIEEKLARLQDSVLKQTDTELQEPSELDMPTTGNDATELGEIPIEHENIIDALKDKGREPEIYQQYIPPVLTPKYPKTLPSGQQPVAQKTRSTDKPDKTAESREPAPLSQPVAILKPEIASDSANAPEPVVAPETPASDHPSAAADSGFALQVASLKDLEKARMLMNKFKAKGYPAFCQSTAVNGATWHRVRIGPYSERTTAEKDQKRLKAAGVDSLVITMN